MDAEFYVLCGFIVFVFLLGYMGVHKMLLAGIDKRGEGGRQRIGASRQAA